MFHHPIKSKCVIGHQVAVQNLESAYASGKLHHANLLIGQQGIGKATFAYQAAGLVLSDRIERLADIAHDVRAKIIHGSHPDLLVIELIDGDKDIKVEQVRKLASFMSKTPAISKNKVVVIDSINDLNNNAANAILKLLEEPTPNTYFFIVCHSLNGILPTIKSRCAMQYFSPLAFADFYNIMCTQKYLEESIAKEIYELAQGSMRNAELFFNEALRDLHKDLENALLYKNISKLEIIKISKKITNENWPAIKGFIEQILVKKAKSYIAEKKLLAINEMNEIEEYLSLLNNADRFYLDKAQLFLVLVGK